MKSILVFGFLAFAGGLMIAGGFFLSNKARRILDRYKVYREGEGKSFTNESKAEMESRNKNTDILVSFYVSNRLNNFYGIPGCCYEMQGRGPRVVIAGVVLTFLSFISMAISFLLYF